MAKITKLVANKRAITRTVASSVQANHAALEENLEQVLFGGPAPAQLNLALTQWTQNYIPVASIIENLYRLAQMPAHAERVRLTTRRRAGTPEPEDIQDEIPTTDSDYTPEPGDVTLNA